MSHAPTIADILDGRRPSVAYEKIVARAANSMRVGDQDAAFAIWAAASALRAKRIELADMRRIKRDGLG